MIPDAEHWRYGGGVSATILHPAVVAALAVAIITILLRRRRAGLSAFLLAACLIPYGQQLVIGGVHLFLYRLLVLVGCVRLLTRVGRGAPLLADGWNRVDIAFLLCIGSHAIAFTILYADTAAVVNQVGYVWDYAGGYIVLRSLIRSREDVTTSIRCLAWVAIICAFCMVRERLTGENLFGVLGGVRLESQVREGSIRAEAVFQHAILAGTFGATLLPALIALWPSLKRKAPLSAAIVASVTMVFTTACSTPVLALAASLAALCFWPLRSNMRAFRWAVTIAILGLHLSMNAPVCALIQRIDVVHGSSSYHRYQLVNQFILHVNEWWLLGTKSNAEWGDEMIDTSNAYVEEGTGGGCVSLISFFLLISFAFGRIGHARKAAAAVDHRLEWLCWCLGAALFAHATAFLGIYYFDQMRVVWFTLLAMISTVSSRRFLRLSMTPPEAARAASDVCSSAEMLAFKYSDI